MGLMWGLFSVIIASAAQLSLGFAASHLPPMTHLWDFIAALLAFGLDARILLLGLLGYLLSVFCWYKTLHKLALSKAYALLSMSYVLVWIASMVLPGWEGTFSLKALLGVACIMSGFDADFPAHNKTTLLSFPCRFTLPFPLIGAITACRKDFHRVQLFTINTVKRILQRRE